MHGTSATGMSLAGPAGFGGAPVTCAIVVLSALSSLFLPLGPRAALAALSYPALFLRHHLWRMLLAPLPFPALPALLLGCALLFLLRTHERQMGPCKFTVRGLGAWGKGEGRGCFGGGEVGGGGGRVRGLSWLWCFLIPPLLFLLRTHERQMRPCKFTVFCLFSILVSSTLQVLFLLLTGPPNSLTLPPSSSSAAAASSPFSSSALSAPPGVLTLSPGPYALISALLLLSYADVPPSTRFLLFSRIPFTDKALLILAGLQSTQKSARLVLPFSIPLTFAAVASRRPLFSPSRLHRPRCCCALPPHMHALKGQHIIVSCSLFPLPSPSQLVFSDGLSSLLPGCTGLVAAALYRCNALGILDSEVNHHLSSSQARVPLPFAATPWGYCPCALVPLCYLLPFFPSAPYLPPLLPSLPTHSPSTLPLSSQLPAYLHAPLPPATSLHHFPHSSSPPPFTSLCLLPLPRLPPSCPPICTCPYHRPPLFTTSHTLPLPPPSLPSASSPSPVSLPAARLSARALTTGHLSSPLPTLFLSPPLHFPLPPPPPPSPSQLPAYLHAPFGSFPREPSITALVAMGFDRSALLPAYLHAPFGSFPSEPSITALVAMGFDRSAAVAALLQCHHDLTLATNLLVESQQQEQQQQL
ncbi:unnamed protein product [Closterium sp. NIES-65]|nr:unnamed protein product [Closterium sp. NIES-65]